MRQTPQYQQVVEARHVRTHPHYNRNLLLNDIALIHLSQRIQFSDTLQLITLPRISQLNHQFIGDGTTIIGWGKWGKDREY